MALGEHKEDWEINEIEVYAKGFEEKSTYISNTLDFEGPAAWGDIRWSGRRDPGAKVHIQTRSGADGDPNVFWQFTGRGGETYEVTQAEYDKLKLGEKAGITFDRQNWTFWSAPYDFADSSGAAVVSLSPRRFLQFKVDFIPFGEDAGSELGVLEVRASYPPLATELLGEVSPIQAEVGKTSRFTYVLKPTIEGDDIGFDGLEMTSASIFKSVEAVRIDGREVAFTETALDEHRFEINFPKMERKDIGALVEVEFEAQVLRYGSTFEARVFDSSQPLEVPQGVSAGDATDEFDGNRVSVATSVGVRSLLEAQVASGVFTPNGDDVNDQVHISYDLFEVTGEGSVNVEIRDLAGRLIRTVYAGQDLIGHYEHKWDGTDDSGVLVSPGLYLYRVSLDTDREGSNQIGTVHVAY